MENMHHEIEPDFHPPIIYHPKPKDSQMAQFRRFVEEKYGIVLNDYWELQEWAIKHFPKFWDCIWNFFGIVHSQPYVEVFDTRKSFATMEWFKGARLNYAENVFKHRDDQNALIVTGDHGKVEYITYKQMYEEVRLYAAALKALGLGKGDSVACYMANKKEAILAFLAAASLGCLWCGVLPLLGVKATIARFDQINPKILFTGGNYMFDGQKINLEEKIPDIIAGLPTLKKVVLISENQGIENEELENIPNCVKLSEFLQQSEFTPILEYKQLPFDYSFTISFTSGTTGKPKALVHSVGAFIVALKDFGLNLDCTRKDVLLLSSPPGWISWHMGVNTLQLGMTLCIYDGEPFLKTSTHFWDIIDKFGLTFIMIWTSTLESIEKKSYLPTSRHHLKSLRQIIALGSPVKLHTYEFIYNKIKPGLFGTSGYGCTEVFGYSGALTSDIPVYRGEIQGFSLAMDFRCIDEKGNYVIGKRGNLVIANPYPGLPITLLDDETRQKMTQLYLSRFPGHWDHGDEVIINPHTRGFVVFGRSDETLLTKGARFSCTEIYAVVASVPEVADSVCVMQSNANFEDRILLFVQMAPGCKFDPIIEEKIRDTIVRDLSPEHAPNIIFETPDIPYNISGKKMTLLVKKILNHQKVETIETVMNPSCLHFYINFAKKNPF